MYQHDELYHYGVKGMRWGIRSRVKVNDSSERKAAQKNYTDYKSGKLGDREYARKDKAIRQAIRVKEKKAAVKELEDARAAELKRVQAMPNSQKKADALVKLNTEQKGLYFTRDGAKKARLEALAKGGMSAGQAKRGLRSYETAMVASGTAVMAAGIGSAILKAKTGKELGALDYIIAAGAGAAAGRGIARVVSDRKKEGTPFKKPAKAKRTKRGIQGSLLDSGSTKYFSKGFGT